MITFFLRTAGSWRPAPVELCSVPPRATSGADIAHLMLTIAGGLALQLSRCPHGTARRTYPSSTELYRSIRKMARRGRIALPEADLLHESFEEMSNRLDPATRVAFRLTLQEAETQVARAASRPGPSASPAPKLPPEEMRAMLSPSSFEISEEEEAGPVT